MRALEIVRERSMEYITDKRPPLQTVELGEKWLKFGWDYCTSKKSVVSFKQPGDDGIVDFYVFAGENLDKITKEHVEKFKSQTFKKFDTFAEKAFAIHQITFKQNSQKWATDSLCTCQSFSKDFICKHVVGIAYRIGILNAPDQVSNAAEGPISAKNKRGRPRKATKALIIDWKCSFWLPTFFDYFQLTSLLNFSSNVFHEHFEFRSAYAQMAEFFSLKFLILFVDQLWSYEPYI